MQDRDPCVDAVTATGHGRSRVMWAVGIVVTIGAIERGIMQQQKRNAVFARELGKWFDQVLSLYAERILPIDRSVAQRWGLLHTRIDLDSALAWAGLTLEDEDRALIPAADAGDAAAQRELGLLFLE
ncbi:hypothetical protein [Rhabdochromatium marinum]|uniref:hypothetical protein n=1 Tax=Rhabdochromatium marinum TaxID=48729 RepID=UPI00190340B0|nr:hypothetical protein [Rhabdochromatium marinum]